MEEEKRFGVDHYDDDIKNTGNSHCLKAYMDYRAQVAPKINSYFASFVQNYTIQKKIRSQGDVYEIRQCKDNVTSEMKAVKVYRKLELTDHTIELIKREIDLLKKLDHPNIIKLHNVIEDVDRVYLIIDDIRGKNLFSHIIEKKQLPESETSAIAAQLASSIKYLHKHGIVVRRLKLDTICFAEQDVI